MEQLKMTRDNTPVALPEAPEGYYIRPFEKGDEEDWCRCCIDGNLGLKEISAKQFEDYMVKDDRVKLHNIYMLYHKNGDVAGTTTYQYSTVPDEGYIHMVGIASAHLGKKLSYYMTMFVVDKIIKDGKKTIVLTTDDDRLAAIKTYINCGFVPANNDPSFDARWNEVYKNLGLER